MDGLETQIRLYGGQVQVAGATTSIEQFQDWLRRLFDYQIKGMPNERIAFAGSEALQVLQNAARRDAWYPIQTNQTDFGLNIHQFTHMGNTLKILSHPMLIENPVWNRNIYAFHPGSVTMHWLRKTAVYDSGSNKMREDGIDATTGDYLSELTMSVGVASVNGIFSGLTAPAKSWI
jgi:hypothetical protein